MHLGQGIFSNLKAYIQRLFVFPIVPLFLTIALETSQHSGRNPNSMRKRFKM